MKYLETHTQDLPIEGGGTTDSGTTLAAQAFSLQERLRALGEGDQPERAPMMLDLAEILIELKKPAQAWTLSREAFDAMVARKNWEGVAQACRLMFLADQPESLCALGQGLWLAVTFPMDPELTVALLQHVVEDTPADSDGAAVAAAAAAYIVDLRAEGKQHDGLSFFTAQLLGTVARRHSGVDDPEEFQAWVERLELNDPQKFLVRLRNIVDVLVQDEWWFNRDAVAADLPVN